MFSTTDDDNLDERQPVLARRTSDDSAACPHTTSTSTSNRTIIVRLVGVVVLVVCAKLLFDFYRRKTAYDGNDGAELDCFRSERDLLALRHIIHAFDAVSLTHGLRYWIDSGSLLGFYRRSDVLPWDRDVDVGMLEEDVPKLLSASAERDLAVWGLSLDREKVHGQYRVFLGSHWGKNAKTGLMEWIATNTTLLREKFGLDEPSFLIALEICLYATHPTHPARLVDTVVPAELATNWLEGWYLYFTFQWWSNFPVDYVFPLRRAEFGGRDVNVPNQVTKMIRHVRFPFSWFMTLAQNSKCWGKLSE